MKLSYVFVLCSILLTGLSQKSSAQSTKVYIIIEEEQPVNYMYKSNTNLMKSALQAADDRIDENLQKRQSLMDWISKLKQKTTDETFISAINSFYNQLLSMDPPKDYAGFSREGPELDNIKSSIKDQIDKYNSKIRVESAKNQSQDLATDYYIQAKAKIERQDYYGAIAEFDKIIELNKAPYNYDLASIQNDKAASFLKLNKLDEAFTDVTKALEISRSKWYIWDTRGEIFYKKEYYTKCIEDMTTAIAWKPNANSYFYRGLSEIKTGDKIDGCKDLSLSGELGNLNAYDKIKIFCNDGH